MRASHKPSPAARNRARRLAMQALYQWQLSATEPTELVRQFESDDEFRGVDRDYFEALVRGVTDAVEELDALFEADLDRPLKEIDPVEKAVLRLAAYELRSRLDVPYRVVLNEAVALTKKFGAEQAHTYVNGVLDKLARRLRSAEQ
ncbi:transcription antitermination factor NusB [Thiohalobacter sp. IOR34]|uniref:transcription antitermination factor NusB n=1 Tax=Thiohalobacter sp. IOR34 TaxID=3057176 RepID=UPI0025B05C8E|nr:transcription antitermination factor NusB [Thiohalobacter sp. IOR34]WJW76222.1 transcription antitermination factor NusB [Thiohalobacter sp. IOR34]